jgi:hypothetical protein
MAQGGVRAWLRSSDEKRGTGDGFDRMIPLEALPARTVILHMRAVSQIELMKHFYTAYWTLHTVMSSKTLSMLS